MNLKNYVEAMKNLPARFSNLTFWRDCRKLKDSVVNALEYLNDWGIGIESELNTKLPKSPSDWEAWTVEEQAEARERIGITSTLMTFYDQTIPYGAEGLGRVITEYYQMASYNNPILVAASISLYGGDSSVFGIYRPREHSYMLCIEGQTIKCLYKSQTEEWSFRSFTLYNDYSKQRVKDEEV